MKDYYIRFGRKYPIPPTIQIKDEIGRMALERSVVVAPEQPQSAHKEPIPLDVTGSEPHNYRLCFLDRNDVVITVRHSRCADDAAALSEGERLTSTHTIEVWCGERKVDRLNRRPRAADPLAASRAP